MATVLAGELGLSLPILLFGVAALVTSLASVSGIDKVDRHSTELGFIGDKLPQLGKAPAMQLGPHHFVSPDPVADTLEVFKRDSAPGAFSEVDDAFGN